MRIAANSNSGAIYEKGFDIPAYVSLGQVLTGERSCQNQ
jgi:hypothetical protein